MTSRPHVVGQLLRLLETSNALPLRQRQQPISVVSLVLAIGLTACDATEATAPAEGAVGLASASTPTTITARRANGSSTEFGPNEVWLGGSFGSACADHWFVDITGDGLADAIGQDDTGRLLVRRARLGTFPGFGTLEPYWSGVPFAGTRGTFFADVNGDRAADAIAVNDYGVVVRPSTAGLYFDSNQPWTQGPFFGRLRTLVGDVNADGAADIVAVHYDSVVVRRSTKTSFGPPATWIRGRFSTTAGMLYLTDVTGDRRADLIVAPVAQTGSVIVRRSTGSSFGPEERWTDVPYYGVYATEFTDVTGDGMADAVVVNGYGVVVRRSTGSGFSPNESWTRGAYYGNVGTYFADLTGDKKSDAIVINDDQVYRCIN
jgi:VCBS repeat protein